MATRLKQDRSRKSGHKHSLNAQDYDQAETARQWPPARIARANLDTAMAMLTSKPVRDTLGYHSTLEFAIREVAALMHVLGE